MQLQVSTMCNFFDLATQQLFVISQCSERFREFFGVTIITVCD